MLFNWFSKHVFAHHDSIMFKTASIYFYGKRSKPLLKHHHNGRLNRVRKKFLGFNAQCLKNEKPPSNCLKRGHPKNRFILKGLNYLTLI